MSDEKERLIRLAIDGLKARIEYSKQSIEQEKRLVRGAPTATETRSDTSRSQLGSVVNILQVKHSDMQQSLIVLEQLKVRGTTIIEGGALVEIEEQGTKTFYLIVPGVLIQLELDDKVIEIVSPASPMARALFGHKAGETVRIKVPAGIRTLKILGVQ